MTGAAFGDKIENDDQLRQAIEALAHVEAALAALRQRVEPVNAALFAAMAEDPSLNIAAMRRRVDAYRARNSAPDTTSSSDRA
ncbi:MAG TPA: hypothetical protein VIP11_14705 [Gemmatimonadaceae bacterium]